MSDSEWMSGSEWMYGLEPTHDFRPMSGWPDDFDPEFFVDGFACAEPVASILFRVVTVQTPASTSVRKLPNLRSTSPRHCHSDGENS
jgi:hypothetical protein